MIISFKSSGYDGHPAIVQEEAFTSVTMATELHVGETNIFL